MCACERRFLNLAEGQRAEEIDDAEGGDEKV